MIKLEVKKGHILQRKGELNTKVYQVESGLLRSYSIDEKGKYIYPSSVLFADLKIDFSKFFIFSS